MFTEQMTQALPFMDVANLNAANNTNVNTLGVNMGQCKRLFYLIGNGALGAAGNYYAHLQSSPNSNFNVVHEIGNNTNTGVINTNFVWATLEVRSDQVTNANSGDKYVRCQITTGGNALTGVWAIGLGGDTIQKPGSQFNLNTTYLNTSNVCNI